MEGQGKAEPGGITVGGSLMHSDERQPDFSGWATKFGLKCSDGRTIMKEAFAHQDGIQVPLVWQHTHDDPGNVLGHALLEQREEGVYARGFFNDSDAAKNAKLLVQHGDIKSLSIFANGLKEQAKNVLHGVIREVSLVLAGANPGALIDNLQLAHGDDVVTLDDEAVIYTGLELSHDAASTSTDAGPTVQEVYDGLSDEQKAAVNYMVGQALEEGKAAKQSAEDAAAQAAHAALPSKTDNKNNGKDGTRMSRNVFEQRSGASGSESEKHELSHDDVRGIAADAMRMGSLKEAVEAYALKHGINNIDILFPDAKNVDQMPDFDKRRTEWVSAVLNGTRHSPFSRIKSITADITHEEARARGYIKGTFKKEEFFGLVKRVTTPSTIYKKQKLDRDDIIDITDFDVVVWLKGEMRIMLDEELARAILVGDGRPVDDEDKIRDPAGSNEGAGIRSIVNDDDLYAATVNVKADITTDAGRVALVEGVMQDMRLYKGSGSPTFYTTLPTLTSLLLAKDGMGRRLWRTASDLATEMGVANVVTVEVMEQVPNLFGIIVNLKDYTVGADRGGDISMFDDFDIDYNQYKYLIETRVSGALTKIRSALIIKRAAGTDTKVAPTVPTYNDSTGALTIPTKTGVVYKRADTGAVVNAAGSPYTVAPGSSLVITSEPAAGYYFDNNVEDEWTFERDPA